MSRFNALIQKETKIKLWKDEMENFLGGKFKTLLAEDSRNVRSRQGRLTLAESHRGNFNRFAV